MGRSPAPNPKTLEEALTLFPGVTASAQHFNGKWRFVLDSDKLFIHDETRWQSTWQAAFHLAWGRYRKYDFDDWQLEWAKAAKGVTADQAIAKVRKRR